MALEPDFGKKVEIIAQEAALVDVTTIGGVPFWMLSILTRALEVSGKSDLLELRPGLELFAHGGAGIGPYRTIYTTNSSLPPA